MQPGKTPRRRAGIYTIAALGLACALAPASAWAAASPPDAGDLSPRLAELTKPAVRAAPPAKQAETLGLAADGPGSLLREGNRVLVEVRFDRGAAAGVEDLRAAGAKIVNVSPRYQTVTVAAKPSELGAIGAVNRVGGVTEALTPMAFSAPAGCPSGGSVSEGDGQLRATLARSEYGVSGTGATVGILSDSFDRATKAANGVSPIATHASEDVESGDLPGFGNPCGDSSQVTVLDDSAASGADEGRAMAQIVHDLAPGSKLAFATAFFSDELLFAENIERLAKPASEGGADADVIADDVIYFDEPFFQDGPVAVAVNKVAADGVPYFSAAGNDNVRVGGKDIGSWEDEFHGSGGCPAGIPHYAPPDQFECEDFDGAGDTGFGIEVKGGRDLLIDLQWAEPWYGVSDDFDAYLVDSANNVVAKREDDNPGKTQKPYELLFWENPEGTTQTVNLVIKRYSGSASPRLKFVMLENGSGDVAGTEHPESFGTATVGPTIFGHAGAAGAMSVAAVPFNGGSAPESYSSRGPVRHYFGPVSGTSPAAELPSVETLSKPDLAATDCGATNFFAFLSGETWRFCGTSAAAPHAAAVAALLRDADPLLTPEQVETVLTTTARSVGGFGPTAVGAGLIDATAALSEVAEPLPPGEEEEEEKGGGGEEEGGPGNTEEQGPITSLADAGQPQQPRGHAGQGFPDTFFRHKPPLLRRTAFRTARVVFGFGSDGAGAVFLCKVDRGRFHRCPARFVRRYRLGRHVVRVKARSSDGKIDRTPAVFRFRVKRVGRG